MVFLLHCGGTPMPYKPRQPCAFPGCSQFAENKRRNGQYCTEHQKVMDKRYNRYERDPESYRRYGRAWKHIRNCYIKAHPLCEECKRQNKLTPAEEVHHIVPLSHGGSNHDHNLMALCNSCHSRFTVESGDRWHDR